MNRSRNREGLVRFLLHKKIQKALPLVREVAPAFQAFFMSQHLDAATNDTEIRRNLQLLFEPLPHLRQ